MKKNGFTLMELLAIIAILGLIIIIVVPKINDVVKDSKKNTAHENANRLVETFEEYFVRKSIGDSFQACSYDFTNDINSCDDYSFDGIMPSGQVSISSSGNINGNVVFNNHEFNITNGEISLVEN